MRWHVLTVNYSFISPNVKLTSFGNKPERIQFIRWRLIHSRASLKERLLKQIKDRQIKLILICPESPCPNYLHYCLKHLLIFAKMKSTDSESSEKRDIFQYHFTSWPDHSVPRDTSAFLMFHHKLRSALAVDPGPIVVHCRYLFIYLFVYLFIYSGANLKLMCFR